MTESHCKIKQSTAVNDRCKIKQSAIEYAERIAAGEIPENFDALTECGRALMQVNAKVSQTLAVIIAGGRRHFNEELGEWIRWCQDEFNIHNASYRCHLFKIGEWLLTLKSDCFILQYKKVFAFPADKLLSMSRIPASQVAAFLSIHDVGRMSRLEVRGAVAVFLGEAPAEIAVAKQPDLPGFAAALDALEVLEPARMISQLERSADLQRALSGGAKLFGAALEKLKTDPAANLATLQSVKLELLDEAKSIDRAIAEVINRD